MTKELIEVNSSNVAAIGFDGGVLTVKYKNNRTYQYHGVPEDVFNEVLKAESVGQALAEKIKGQYPTEPVKKEETDDKSETKPEDEAAGDSEPDTDQGDATQADEAGGEAGETTPAEGVNDESDTDTASNAGEKQEAESGSVEEPAGQAEAGSGEPSEQPGADTTDTPDSAPPDDGDNADGAGEQSDVGASTETGKDDDGGGTQEENDTGEVQEPVSGGVDGDTSGTDQGGGEKATPTLGLEADDEEITEMINDILKHFKGDGLEQVGVREDDQVIIFSVYKEDEDVSDVPIEIVTGTLLELFGHATTKTPEAELDQTPTEDQSENLDLLRDELSKFEIDLQYERVEDKIGDRYWNLKASVEREDRTLTYTTRIVENCTKDEAETAAEDIVANFVKAG